MIEYTPYLIHFEKTILEALAQINENDSLTLFLMDDEGTVIGTVTDGDVRRGLLNNRNLNEKVFTVCKKEFHYLNKENATVDYIRELKGLNIKLIPFLDEHNKIEKIVKLSNLKNILPIDAVIMAGGRGERMRPLTDSVPKPMLILGDKPIIEHNIDRLKNYGIENIYITIKYLGEQIVDYFKDGSDKNLIIKYVKEERPLGTIGSVRLINDFNSDTILIMNSDLFTNIDFEEFFIHFTQSNADMSVASIPYSISVPYAVMEVDGETINSFTEKPTYTYYSNAGIYLLKKEIIDLIPISNPFDATDLMQTVIDSKRKLTYFPIVGFWIDIGKHEDYKRAQEFIKFLSIN